MQHHTTKNALLGRITTPQNRAQTQSTNEVEMKKKSWNANPSQDSSVDSISAWYRGSPWFQSGEGKNFSMNISN